MTKTRLIPNGQDQKTGPAARFQKRVRGNDLLDEFLRHLENIEIDLSDNEMTVESYPPSKATAHGELESTLSRTFDLEEDRHKKLRKAVLALVEATQEALLETDEEYQPDRCDRCRHSDCCHIERIHLSEDERRAILDYLGLDDDQATYDRYFERDEDLGGYYKSMFRHVKARNPREKGDTHCVFLKEMPNGMMGCSIYPVRPKVCRDYDAAYCTEWTDLAPKGKVKGPKS
ncbi:MAG: YkgJ family cysteine cluster protein [Planctomycetota bacterium]